MIKAMKKNRRSVQWRNVSPAVLLIITVSFFLTGTLAGCSRLSQEGPTVYPVMNNSMANSYVVSDSGEAAVVDPSNTDAIVAVLKKQRLSLKYILLTHGHFDHIVGLDSLHRRFPEAQILAHPRDLDKPGDPERNLSLRFGLNIAAASKISPVKEGNVLKIGNTVIRVLETPGHTMGSIVFLVGNNLLTGDTLLKNSVGRTDFPDSSEVDMEQSLKKIIKLPDNLKVYPGHGELTVLGDEKKNNPILKDLKGDKGP